MSRVERKQIDFAPLLQKRPASHETSAPGSRLRMFGAYLMQNRLEDVRFAAKGFSFLTRSVFRSEGETPSQADKDWLSLKADAAMKASWNFLSGESYEQYLKPTGANYALSNYALAASIAVPLAGVASLVKAVGMKKIGSAIGSTIKHNTITAHIGNFADTAIRKGSSFAANTERQIGNSYNDVKNFLQEAGGSYALGGGIGHPVLIGGRTTSIVRATADAGQKAEDLSIFAKSYMGAQQHRMGKGSARSKNEKVKFHGELYSEDKIGVLVSARGEFDKAGKLKKVRTNISSGTAWLVNNLWKDRFSVPAKAYHFTPAIQKALVSNVKGLASRKYRELDLRELQKIPYGLEARIVKDLKQVDQLPLERMFPRNMDTIVQKVLEDAGQGYKAEWLFKEVANAREQAVQAKGALGEALSALRELNKASSQHLREDLLDTYSKRLYASEAQFEALARSLSKIDVPYVALHELRTSRLRDEVESAMNSLRVTRLFGAPIVRSNIKKALSESSERFEEWSQKLGSLYQKQHPFNWQDCEDLTNQLTENKEMLLNIHRNKVAKSNRLAVSRAMEQIDVCLEELSGLRSFKVMDKDTLSEVKLSLERLAKRMKNVEFEDGVEWHALYGMSAERTANTQSPAVRLPRPSF